MKQLRPARPHDSPSSSHPHIHLLSAIEKMTRKGLRNLLPCKPLGRRHHRDSPSAAATSSSSSSSSSLSLEEKVARAEPIVVKWDPESSAYAKITSLFYEDRSEARRFLAEVSDLQRAMLVFVAAAETARLSHPCLVRAQTLMQAAMRRLEKEFFQILAANRDLLDPESVSVRSARSSVSEEPDYDPWENSPEGEALAAGKSIGEVERAAGVVMADLRAIADTMVLAGYGKECVRTYKALRKSIVDEGLYRLGFERLPPAQVQKLDWAVLELRVRSWLGASRVAVRTLFHGERVLLDHVFAGSDAVREVVFADIAGDAALKFLSFPGLVAKSKRSPEKLFRLLDLYDAVAELRPEIEPIFSFDSTAAVRAQALASLSKLAEAARATLADFESAIMKESSRLPVPGGGVHPMTRYAMNYISLLADYQSALVEIFADFPIHTPTPIPPFFFDTSQAPALQQPAVSGSSAPPTTSSSSEGSRRSAIAARFAWLILSLLCKLDGKAAAYADVGLSYLFLANNLQYIVNKARSCRLRDLLGEEWAAWQAAKARQHAAGYERAAWGRVAATIPTGDVSAGEARGRMRAFSAALEEACAAQTGWVVADAAMREEVRATVRGMILPAYRGFYTRWEAALEDTSAVLLSPDDVGNRLGGLFPGSGSHRPKESSSRTV
ncbi:exocyst complex component EXO70H1-like [Musa acuminata AAA Group]|uniref:exocyst complex component EXO70H1-like n=1 Tax=Musa acuminata AAA Group TaxID=214697 RepID=UPI0031D25B81